MSTSPETSEVGGPRVQSGSGRRGKGYFLPGIIALVALLAIGVFFVGAGDLQHPAATELTGSDTASQIALAIQAQENSPTAPTVTCPAREPVHQGTRFQCVVKGSPDRTVFVTEVDGRGRVRWSFSAG